MEWISVSDRLPGYNKVVLWVHKGCVHAGSLGVSDTGLKFYHAEDCFEPDHISDVAWWMPYPNPPKSEQGDSKNSSQAVQQLKAEISATVSELEDKVAANEPVFGLVSQLKLLSQKLSAD